MENGKRCKYYLPLLAIAPLGGSQHNSRATVREREIVKRERERTIEHVKNNNPKNKKKDMHIRKTASGVAGELEKKPKTKIYKVTTTVSLLPPQHDRAPGLPGSPYVRNYNM